MKTLEFELPYTDVTLILDSLRHYINYIDGLDESTIDEDTLADLLNDNENLKALEKDISARFTKKFGSY
ncbi:hypothetical protein BTA51_08250 [Hahella sp. CCB-MM4]|uniref:hypothetical protein n=1 Tax=Hahella sp. (strain CCB-MM4) TaxID=1926491 RepID=UPI000B9C5B47|nr:hypothetical protein [Hahella sp. CCB-MM4]OZG73790.1 hypothetical protein BTA51_08250 [Hahella sp. CCB-MM4]